MMFEEEWRVDFYCTVNGRQETLLVKATSELHAIQAAKQAHGGTACFTKVKATPPTEIDHL